MVPQGAGGRMPELLDPNHDVPISARVTAFTAGAGAHRPRAPGPGLRPHGRAMALGKAPNGLWAEVIKGRGSQKSITGVQKLRFARCRKAL